MEEVAMEESPHHLYYLMINEQNKELNTEIGRRKIADIDALLQRKKIPKRNIEMVVYNAHQMVRKQDNVTGSFEDYKLAMQYLSKTRILSVRRVMTKPHIIINKNATDWHYFLEKNEYKRLYHFHYVRN